MGLQLKEGWTERPEKRFGKVGGSVLNDFITRSYDGSFVAWPNGGPDSAEVFPTIEEAHAYLLSAGSESPFHDLDELTAAAEGEGPSVDDDAEACRQHRANLHRIQVVDDGAANRCRCAWVVTEPPAPRLCAVDRLEAAGYVTKICDGWIAFYSTSHGMTVSIKPTRRAGYFQAKGALGTTGDESPGLNAAIESLLAKPVGAVTVAQILGVA